MNRNLIALLICCFTSTNLFSQIYFKNEAPFVVWVAIGYLVPSTDEWYSEGWYKLDDNATVNLFNYKLTNRYYYYYAYDDDGNYWMGTEGCSTCGDFLVNPNGKFTIKKPSSYSGSTYEWKKFKRIDTGSSDAITLKISGDDWCSGDCENGYGAYKWVSSSKKYTGYWSGGKRTGQGTCEYGKYHSTYANCKFNGEWRDNTWYTGTFTWPDGAHFTGKWVDEKKSGKGTMVWATGATYEGNWSNDKQNGTGVLNYGDKIYTGNWVDDKREGTGTCTYNSNHSSLANCKFVGQWTNNTWSNGTFYYADGSRYTGAFNDTQRHGKGILYSSSGAILQSGEWANDKLIQSDNTKPSITWDAPIARETRTTTPSYKIKACIYSQSSLQNVKVLVNGKVYKDRGFSVENNCTQTVDISVPLSEGYNTIYITAANTAGSTQSETRNIQYNSKKTTTKGQYYGLFIGIKDYTDLALPDLENPVNDALNVKNILVKDYNFEANNTYLLKNPNKEAIVTKIVELQETLGESDYLLIFFAGHGKMQGNEGYWLAADAKSGNAYNWMSSSELNSYLKNFKSKHILLISDACYSGAFVMRDADDIGSDGEEKACEILESQKSRCAITSGAKTSVPDKSTFIEYLTRRLSENTESCISAEQLYLKFKTAVIANSPNGQIPQFGQIPQTGHEGGGFIFYKK